MSNENERTESSRAERLMTVSLNPLDLNPLEREELSLEDLLGIVCPPNVPRSPSDLRQRDSEVSGLQPTLFAPPAEARILNQLVWPLRQAKAAYVTGNYLATIALSGIVAEMTAILLFEGLQLERRRGALTETQQMDLFGRAFEDLSQDRRTRVLRAAFGLNEDLFQAFSRVRSVRNRHLHMSSNIESAELAADARNAFKDTVLIVAGALGQTIDSGRLQMHRWVWRYLKAKGFVA
jgi:hypothetical protein